MKILFISGELIAGDLAYKMKKEGHDVKLYTEYEGGGDCFDNMVEKTKNWKNELQWVGKDGLIVFDDIGYGKEQDELRAAGYTVFGGCEEGDRLEHDREYGQSIFASHGMKIKESKSFTDPDEAIDYIKKNKCAWVLKQNTHESSLACVGMVDDGRDIVSVVDNCRKHREMGKISLQKKADGIEVGTARYFNGYDWTGPIEMNVEYKSFLNGDIGPLTAEMGTVMWYEERENKLFNETLSKLKPFLQKIKYKGDIDINCIVNKDTAIPVEATMRFGSPAIHAQEEIHKSPWAEFLTAIAKGEDYDLKYKKGYSIVVSVAVPPFPYKATLNNYLKNVDIIFKEELTEEEKEMIHFEEAYFDKNKQNYCIGGSEGYILYVTGLGKDINEARNKVYNLIKKIIIPKMMYRTDIGVNFAEKDEKLLREWGWI
jgi:phosphoribosylamine--glycine ligase